jgi:hypothetical protein
VLSPVQSKLRSFEAPQDRLLVAQNQALIVIGLYSEGQRAVTVLRGSAGN